MNKYIVTVFLDNEDKQSYEVKDWQEAEAHALAIIRFGYYRPKTDGMDYFPVHRVLQVNITEEKGDDN